MIISKAPYRISFFGGGTDFPEWFNEHGGCVLSTTIDKYCYISLRKLPPFFYHKHRIVYSEIELVEDAYQIKHPSVRESFKFSNITEGIELHHDGDLPSRSGLGSSSSFTIALIHAISAYQGKMIDKKKLYEQAIFIERTLLKEAGGFQDQVAISYGGFNELHFTSREIRITPLIFAHGVKFDLEQSLCLFFTGKSRIAEEIEKEKLSSLKDKTIEMKTLFALVDEAKEILRSPFKAKEFGNLLDETWHLKKSLAKEVSNSSLDEIYNKAIRAGSYGGKLLGAGGGGFFLFCIDSEIRQNFIEYMKPLLHVPFRFETGGAQIILYDP